MKRLILLLILFVNLQIVITHEDMRLFSYSTASAQHMTKEAGDNCQDPIDHLWYRFPFSDCEEVIVTPYGILIECPLCHKQFTDFDSFVSHDCPRDNMPNGDSNGGSGGSGSSGSGGSGGGSGSSTGGSNGSSSGNSSSNGGSGYNEMYNSNVNIFVVPPHTPIDLEGALIAGFAYDDGDKYKKELNDSYRWDENTSIPQDAGVIMHDLESGFDCRFMVKKDEQGKIVGFVLTFAGTDFLKNHIYQVNSPNGTDYVVYNPDVCTDITQFFGMNEQYKQALINAQRLSDYLQNDPRYKDIPLTFVGHSLGGGMAALASIVTGRTAITYNPAGLSSSTLSWLQDNGYGHDTSHILQYIADRDEVHIAQTFGNIESQGSVIWVPNVQSCAFEHPISSMIDNLRK